MNRAIGLVELVEKKESLFMSRDEVFEKLNEVFRDVFDDDSIAVTDPTTAGDIDGWDSLSHIALISAVEDEFNVNFSMREVIGMKNVGEMVDVLERELS